MDRITPEVRSKVMARVRAVNTKPELVVRRLVYSMGYRYRLHKKDLPGKPDLAFVGMRRAIFVHGCFWHRHACRSGRKVPKTNRQYWLPKLARNKRRDLEHLANLRSLGWSMLVIWECEVKNAVALKRRIIKFLGSKK
jgi:DNA mismatch endonuclease (patch repair protein)